jgi:predicted membrane protein
MITTKKVKLTPREFFLILIIRHIKKQWWLFAAIWFLAIIFLVNGINDPVQMFFPVFAIIYPALIVIQFWKYVTSKDNKLLLLERYYEIDNEKINGVIDRDTYSPIKLDHFIKVDWIRNTYLLYVSKNQFIYIPVDAFESDPDREWFEKEILTRIKK